MPESDFNIFTLINEIKHTNGIEIDTTSEIPQKLSLFKSKWVFEKAIKALDKLKKMIYDKYEIFVSKKATSFKGIAKIIFELAKKYNNLICDCNKCKDKYIALSIVYICMLFITIYENPNNEEIIKEIQNDMLDLTYDNSIEIRISLN